MRFSIMPSSRLGAVTMLVMLVVLSTSLLGFRETVRSASSISEFSLWKRSWPMVGHDPQRTGRSSAAVGLHLHLRGTFPNVWSPAVVAPGGSLYTWSSQGLIALTAGGAPRWIYPARAGFGGPPVITPRRLVVANGGTQREGARSGGVVLALKADGALAWKVRHVGFSQTSPPLATKRAIYVPFVGPRPRACGLAEIFPSGRDRRLQNRFAFMATALAPHRSIYAVGRYVHRQHQLRIERLTPAGRLLWSHRIGRNGYGLVVGSHGTVFVSDGSDVGRDSGRSGTIRAYDRWGRLLWVVRTRQGQSSLAQTHNGEIVAAGQLGITAMSPQGVIRWTAPLAKMGYETVPAIAIDGHDRSYVESGDGIVHILSNQGRVLGQLPAGGPRVYWQPSLAISRDGHVVVLGSDNVLRIYASWGENIRIAGW